MRAAIFITVIFWVSPGFGATYKWFDESGVVQYSDRPIGEDAQEVKLPPGSHHKPAEYTLPPAADEPADEADPYDEVTLVTPQPDATLRDNRGNVDVEVALKPTLRKGDTLTVLLDGQTFSDAVTNARMILQKVDRGTHQLQVKVLDPKGTEVAVSPVVTFHLHRAIAPMPQPK